VKPSSRPPSGEDKAEPNLRDKVIAALKTVYDPEIPVDIWELGLVYRIDIAKDGSVAVEMTLTSPGCPVAGSLPATVENRIREIDGVKDLRLALVWEPAWSPKMMSEAARLTLGFG